MNILLIIDFDFVLPLWRPPSVYPDGGREAGAFAFAFAVFLALALVLVFAFAFDLILAFAFSTDPPLCNNPGNPLIPNHLHARPTPTVHLTPVF